MDKDYRDEIMGCFDKHEGDPIKLIGALVQVCKDAFEEGEAQGYQNGLWDGQSDCEGQEED